jgi:hypothetical protein
MGNQFYLSDQMINAIKITMIQNEKCALVTIMGNMFPIELNDLRRAFLLGRVGKKSYVGKRKAASVFKFLQEDETISWLHERTSMYKGAIFFWRHL